MNREIKFRTYNADNGEKEWNKSMTKMNYEPKYFGEQSINKLIKSQQTFEVWMQFTGLKDAKGVEIYEGDIILFKNPDDKSGQWHHHEVKFPNDWLWLSNNTFAWRMEVIGNIYENPELINSNESK